MKAIKNIISIALALMIFSFLVIGHALGITIFLLLTPFFKDEKFQKTHIRP